MSLYPMMLYRSGDQFVWDGKGTEILIVDDKEQHAAAAGDGWLEAADYLAADEPAIAKPTKENAARKVSKG